MKSTHSARLERWLGAERIEEISKSMRGWYGRPLHLLDVPGSVRVCSDGDFIGPFDRGYFMSAADSLAAFVGRLGRVNHGTVGTGFASISDALVRASGGFDQGRQFHKTGSTGVAGAANTLWRVAGQPSAGAAGSAAPGGRACDRTTAGAFGQTNPASGTLHLVGADAAANIVNNSCLIYDRIFDVAKTMNSTATEAVTGVPTRYQSITASDAEYIGDNFLFAEVFTALAATAHNWTTCTYTDQGNAASTVPSIAGVSGAIIDRLDHAGWFIPLAAGDIGIKALTQMQCSASVATGAINFVIGHPIGFMSYPVVNVLMPFDWLTNRQLTPRIIDGACLSFLEVNKPATTATTYNGRLHFLNAS